MPSAWLSDDDDPVIASYDVFITEPTAQDNSSVPRLFVLQYPSHRPSSKPYNAARSQKPTLLRLKPNTGIVEVEVPILTQENYNPHAGEKFGHSLTESQLSRRGGSYGLAGGFSYAPAPTQNTNIHDIPQHGETDVKTLQTQTLGGKLVTPGQRDPVYMLGSFHHNELYLSHLDGVVQMRPQLHHIDAEDEIEKRKIHAANGGRVKQGFDAPTKLETKAIELKLKKTDEDPKDRNLNKNALLLRDIQAEQWSSHDWIDQEDEAARKKVGECIVLRTDNGTKDLQSIVNNDDWLDKMSAPREDGKKGLRSKLKGRDRERARRKKVESQRRRTNTASGGTSGALALTSDSDASAIEDHSGGDVLEPPTAPTEPEIKQEPENLATAPSAASEVADPVPVTSPPARKRGRPKKTGAVNTNE